MVPEKTKAREVLHLKPQDAVKLCDLHHTHPNGVEIVLSAGEFKISKTILLPSNVSIRGAGPDKTLITLQPYSNCHLFTNANHRDGNSKIELRDFSVQGNGDQQEKPETAKAITFSCATYLMRVRSVMVENCHFDNIRQTAVHVSRSADVVIQGLRAKTLGWSGVSTSDTSNIWIKDTIVDDAGRDINHSAIHIDGGAGIYVEAKVSNTTGNGIMMDSSFAPLKNAVVKGEATTCKRGVSLVGSGERPVVHVYIEGKYNDNRETGIMISNAQFVVVNKAEAHRNGLQGILLQGRIGGCDCILVDCDAKDNGLDLEMRGPSIDNWAYESPDIVKNPQGTVGNRLARLDIVRSAVVAPPKPATQVPDVAPVVLKGSH